MTLYLTQMNMSRGEFSLRARSRMDVDMYAAGMAEVLNFLVMKQGGVTRRPGTEYIADGRGSNPIRLIPFVFGVLDTGPQSYILELSSYRFRVYTIEGQVISGTPVTIVTPWPYNVLFELDFVQSADVLYVSHPNYQTQKITRTSDTSWTCENYVNEDGPYLPDLETGLNTTLTFDATNDLAEKAGITVTGTAPGDGTLAAIFDDDLDTFAGFDGELSAYVDVDFSGTDEYICVGYSMTCRTKPSKSGIYSWNFQGYNGTNWVTLDNQSKTEGWQVKEKAYFPIVNKNAYQQYRLNMLSSDNISTGQNFQLTSLELAWDPDEMDTITVTASSTVDINSGVGFTSNDVGRVLKFRADDGFWRWCRIDSVTSSTIVEVKMYGPALPTAQTVVRWRLGAWSPGTGWPSKTAFYEERLFFGKNNNNPQRLWSSKTSDYTDFGVSSPLVADDALEMEMIGGEVNSIQFLVENQDLIVGTTKTIRAITVANTQQGFSATNAKQQRQVSVGAAPVRPVSTGQVVLFVDYYHMSIRELTFSYESNSYVAPELTVLAEHLFKGRIIDMAFSQQPLPILWVVLADGKMVTITYDRDQKIVACTQCEIAGEGAYAESVAVVPGTDRDEVWIAVRRTIAGLVVRRVERFYKMFDDEETDIMEARYLDSHVLYEGEPANLITGLEHLASHSVSVNGDGFEYRDLTVDASGQLLLPEGEEVTRAVIGIPYVSQLRQLYPSQGVIDGSRIGRKWKVMRVVLDVVASLGLKYGTDRKMRDLFKRLTSDGDPSEQMKLRYGMFGAFGDSSWKENDTMLIVNDTPFPSTILSITVGIEGEP